MQPVDCEGSLCAARGDDHLFVPCLCNVTERQTQLKTHSHGAAGEALARSAKDLEETSPADAHALYREALDMYEVDGKEGQVGWLGAT